MKRSTQLTALAFLVGGAVVPFTTQQGCGSSSSGDSSVNTGVNAIVFIQRQHTVVGANGQVTVDVAGGNGQVLDYDRFVPGGSLNFLSPPRFDTKPINMTAAFPTADFNGADVSFDATQAVFSMKQDENDHYHIYTVQLAASPDGSFEIHQKTFGDYDDINPIYIPGGRIAFTTNEMFTSMGTRADEYEHGRVVTQLATISVAGGDADRRLASQNLSHTVAPFLRSDGKIGYCRWEHLGGVNDVKLFAANPDGTQMLAVSGQHGKSFNSLFTPKELSPNVMIGIATTRNRTIHAGALVKIDARNQNDPNCLDDTADHTGHACLDEENVQFDILTPDVPTGSSVSPVGRYREPSLLPDGRILVSWADGAVNDTNEISATPPDFGIYVFDPNTKTNQLVYNDRAVWDLNAIAVTPRTEPPVIGDLVSAQADKTTPVRIGSVNVHLTSLTDTVSGAQFQDGTPLSTALNEAVKVRVIEGFSSEAAKGVTMFGLTMDEGAAVLGEATVYPDGSWLANVPPYIPMHMQPIDKWGMAIRNQRLWIQGMPGEDRRCVGCHESRTGAAPARTGPTLAEQAQAQDFSYGDKTKYPTPAAAIAARSEYPWASTTQYPSTSPNLIQPVLDAKCGSCHDGGASDPFAGKQYNVTATDPATGKTSMYSIPYLNLSSTDITVVYDRKQATYPMSYVSLFYPAAMTMGMVTVTGTQPKMWAVPNSARTSALIEKINVKAPDGSMAFKGAMHPEDKGVTLTDEERQMLIRSIDLGGQFYARQNTGFAPYAQDPLVTESK
jgi:hypothetical protein